VRIGELLVQAGVLSEAKLQEALELQKAEGGKRRLGRLLAEQGFVEETQLTQVLGRQLSVPWVSLYHVDFSRQLLNLVPREVAEGYGVVPVYVRNVRGQGETLYVATDDPTNDEGLRRASAYAGLPVRPMIASSSDIRAAIRVYYGGAAASAPKQPVAVKVEHVEPPKSEAKPPPPRPSEAKPSQPAPEQQTAAAPKPEPAPEPRAEPAPKPRPAYDDAPEIEAKTIPIPPRKKGGRAIALTFLDGTQINLPAPRISKKAKVETPQGEEPEELTARDLVSALRAVSHGAEASEILGENPRWETMFAALLSLLLKKHLIADWEFVEEFRKV
jgi:type IV pilus assembly protein PilB